MGWGNPYGSPFNETSSSNVLSDIWDCAINGRPFRFDRKSDAFNNGMQTIAAMREQSDNSSEPGEQSISREELWRAGQMSWHKGAGQRFRDKADSDPYRFWQSKNINVWTRDQFSLLHGTSLVNDEAAASSLLMSSGDHLYFAHGSTIERSDDGETWTAFSGTTGTVNSMTSDGNRIWVVTSTGTFKMTAGDATFSAWTVDSVTNGVYSLIAYVNDRLVLAQNQLLYEVDGTGTRTALNPDNGNTAWRWTSIVEGSSAIYAAGYAGNRSQIYSIRPPTDDPSATLGVPIPASTPMPSGEIIRCLYSYLGLVCIGTDKGLRVASKITDYAGRELLSVGALITLDSPVTCMDGYGEYVYFGWSEFDDDSSGIGRLDLGTETLPGVYAYASDLMGTAQGATTGIAYFNGSRYFSVAEVGVFNEADTYADEGWLDSGIIRYQLIDTKVAQRVEVRHDSLDGAVGVSISSNGNPFISIGANSLENSVAPNITFNAKQLAGYNFNVKTTLTPSATNSATPIVQQVELRSSVIPSRGDTFLVPLLLEYSDSDYEARHPSDDFEFLRVLARSQHTATYQELSKVFDAIVLDYQFQRGNKTKDGKFWNGTFILKMMAPAA